MLIWIICWKLHRNKFSSEIWKYWNYLAIEGACFQSNGRMKARIEKRDSCWEVREWEPHGKCPLNQFLDRLTILSQNEAQGTTVYLIQKSSATTCQSPGTACNLRERETKDLTFLKEDLHKVHLSLWILLMKAIIYLLPEHVAFHQGLNQYFSLHVKLYIFLE